MLRGVACGCKPTRRRFQLTADQRIGGGLDGVASVHSTPTDGPQPNPSSTQVVMCTTATVKERAQLHCSPIRPFHFGGVPNTSERSALKSVYRYPCPHSDKFQARIGDAAVVFWSVGLAPPSMGCREAFAEAPVQLLYSTISVFRHSHIFAAVSSLFVCSHKVSGL